MTVNSNNYEEFFLLYVDNELDAELRSEVEDFAAQHPNLQKQLDTLLQTKLSSTEEIVFENKSLLYKQENAELITPDNYETFFLLYADNELPEELCAAVEAFIAANPEKKKEWILLQYTKLQVDDSIKFPDKQRLYRLEKKSARIVHLTWMRISAAAAVIITGGLIWMNMGNKQKLTDNKAPQVVAANPGITPEQNIAPTAILPKEKKISGVEKITTEVNTGQGKSSERINRKQIERNAAFKVMQVKETIPSTSNIASLQESPDTKVLEAVQPQIKVQTMPEPSLVFHEEVKTMPDRKSSPVKPVILDAAAFNGDRDKRRVVEKRETEDSHYLSIYNDDKKTNGKLRGLFRKVSRLIDRATIAEPEEGKSVVRIASFEIAKK